MAIETSFQEDGYTILHQVLPPNICQLLSEYALFKSEVKPNVRRGSDTLADIHREYGDNLMELFLEKLRPNIEKATGLKLWPALSFYYTYYHGNLLKAHRDRVSCEISATMCLGFDEGCKQSWPICLENKKDPSTPIKVELNPGDILVFRGSQTTHWREPFEGQWHTQTLLSYVQQEGRYSYQKFDQRKSLGRPHIGMFNWMFRHAYYQLRQKIGFNHS